MYVCFPDDNKYMNMVVSAVFPHVDGTMIQITANRNDGYNGTRVKFPGVNNNVSGANTDTGLLKKGQYYIVYHIRVNNAAITANYGKLEFYLETSKNDEIGENIGGGYIYVQRTYGNYVQTTITPDQFQELLETIENYAMVTREFMEDTASWVADVENKTLSLRSWSGLGFIDGEIRLTGNPAEDDDSIDKDPDFYTVATLKDTVSTLKWPATVFGVIMDGDRKGSDVQFRLSSTEADENGLSSVVLGMSKDSVAQSGDTIAVTGIVPFNGNALKFDPASESGAKEITISGIESSVKMVDYNATPSCSYEYVKSDSGELLYRLRFVFEIPKPIGIKSVTSKSDAGVNTVTFTTDDGKETSINVLDGPSVTVDSSLSDSSTNPVENQAVTKEINKIKAQLDELRNKL
jgi:hypothetical protein